MPIFTGETLVLNFGHDLYLLHTDVIAVLAIRVHLSGEIAISPYGPTVRPIGPLTLIPAEHN
jgi:hypothetical protein